MEQFSALAIKAFEAEGREIECRVVNGANLLAELERAAAEADILVAGGGDGTISAAAGASYRAGVPLAVIPAGTMNLFARALQVPLDLDQALAAIASGTIRSVDIGTANGRPFVHQFSVGIHTKLVMLRQGLTYHSRIGKMIASCRAAVGALLNPPRFRADVFADGVTEARTCSAIIVTNNPLGEGHAPHPDGLAAGLLGIYIAKPMSMWELLKLCVSIVRGRWKDHPRVIEKQVQEVVLTFPRRKSSAMATLDGELIELAQRIELRVHPKGLLVVVPTRATAAADANAASTEAQ
jgi:diacylglycerol kinase family enzyme